MMVRFDSDLARAALVHWFSIVPEDAPPIEEPASDFICHTPRGSIRVPAAKKARDHNVEDAASLVPEWLAEQFKVGTLISMSREDFHGLPEEVRRYMESF